MMKEREQVGGKGSDMRHYQKGPRKLGEEGPKKPLHHPLYVLLLLLLLLQLQAEMLPLATSTRRFLSCYFTLDVPGPSQEVVCANLLAAHLLDR